MFTEINHTITSKIIVCRSILIAFSTCQNALKITTSVEKHDYRLSIDEGSLKRVSISLVLL